MTKGATKSELNALEAALGTRLIPEHREVLSAENGFERWYGDTFLMIYNTQTVIDINDELAFHGTHPGLLIFASDGGRELFGLDIRDGAQGAVVMIDITSEGWHGAIYQAQSMSEFMQQRARNEPFRWDS